ncbi:hypothetical protein B0H34DRAFT_758877 [Crassisporium funariophilum]|nr:hypothetical protein B0H34DRAFT_758877 [Crassisporium funariophilum]
MGRPKLWRHTSAAHARAFKSSKKSTYSSPLANSAIFRDAEIDSDIEILGNTSLHTLTEERGDEEFTKWTSGVNHYPETDNSDFSWEYTSSEEETSDSDEPQSDKESDAEEKEEMVERLRRSMEHEDHLVKCVTAYDILMLKHTKKEWKKAESNRSLGYNGNSGRSQRRSEKNARDKEAIDAKLRKSNGAAMMRNFLVPKPPKNVNIQPEPSSAAGTLGSSRTATHGQNPPVTEPVVASEAIFTGYLSDVSEDLPQLEDNVDIMADASESEALPPQEESDAPGSTSGTALRVCNPPPLKRRRLDVPIRMARQKAQQERRALLQQGLCDIEKLIASKKTRFTAGREGLQAYRTRAIQSYLHMVVKNGRKGMDASERAAEAQGFSAKWGARLVRQWVKRWLNSRTLPESKRGQHVKSFSLLEDPAICAELRSFVRSNKWAMNPSKLVEFSQKTMIPTAAKQYLRHIVDQEMPRGLKKYLEVELFPRIQHSVTKGVSIETARHFLRKEGFRYVEHKKGLYYDGHERPDVVEYRQNVFLPQMKAYRSRLVEYQPDNLTEEVIKIPDNYVEPRLVLVPQDEMTAQANDGMKKSWVMEGEQPLKKKGVGRGIHQSDVICATVGWMKEASVSMEYGKNYEGYWDGARFVKQIIEKIIPAFEAAHGPGYQALIMVDNSQGHCAYAEDALLTSRMNLRPGGKQARLRDGWFLDGTTKVVQKMVFPPDHSSFPDRPKGMKQRWLREHCDYTFSTLQENMPIALSSVNEILIRKWQNRMIRWMDAYRDGLTAKDAQLRVQAFSSKKYTSHRRVPESVAILFD